MWRKQEKECFLTLRGHADWVTRAIFDNDGLLVVSCSYDKHAKLWRLSDGEEQLTFYGHESWVSDVAFSPEGRSIATASGDFTVRIWQARGALTRRTTHAHTRRAAPAGGRARRTAHRARVQVQVHRSHAHRSRVARSHAHRMHIACTSHAHRVHAPVHIACMLACR